MNTMTETWKEVTRLLEEARGQLAAPGPEKGSTSPIPAGWLTGSLGEFEEFLAHNELELAWDVLASIAERTKAPAVCWQPLSLAARLMRLPEKEALAARHATSSILVSG